MKPFLTMTLTLIALAPVALHGQAPVDEGCTNATLKGAYGVTLTGTGNTPTVPANSVYLPGALQQVVGIVLQIYDGKGSFTQIDNVKGNIGGIVQDRPGRGTYTVNPDCTCTQTVIPPGDVPPVFTKCVIVDGGKEIRAVVVLPLQNMTLANGRKVN